MSGAIPSLPQYSFMEWCSIKAQGQRVNVLRMFELITCLILILLLCNK